MSLYIIILSIFWHPLLICVDRGMAPQGLPNEPATFLTKPQGLAATMKFLFVPFLYEQNMSARFKKQIGALSYAELEDLKDYLLMQDYPLYNRPKRYMSGTLVSWLTTMGMVFYTDYEYLVYVLPLMGAGYAWTLHYADTIAKRRIHMINEELKIFYGSRAG